MAQITTTHLTNSPSIIPQDTTILQMPLDIVSQIFTHSSGQEIGRSAQVCRQWHQMVNDFDWRLLFSHHFPTGDSSAIQNFKEAYQAQFKLNSNFTNGVYASHTLYDHQDEVTCLLFAQGKLISGCCDNTMKIWDSETGDCMQTLRGHEDHVISLAFAQGKLISGSADNTIKIWDLETGACTQTLQGHEKGVLCVAFAEGKLISGSDDNTIKIWDLETGACTQTLQGHEHWVFCLEFAQGQLISGSYDNTIKIWDLEKGACTQTLEGHENGVLCLVFAQGKLFSGSADCTIEIRDFAADHAKVFEEIAQLLKNENPKVVEDALERFSRMPKTAKNGMYGKTSLYQSQ